MYKHKEDVRKRTLDAARFIVEHNSTLRKTAQKIGYSKTTVHKDLTENLPLYDKELAEQVRAIIEINKKERSSRGGLALKNKYLMQKQKNKQKVL